MSDYIFYNEDNSEISIDDITPFMMFSAKDVDGNYITDEEGNNVFSAQSSVKIDKVMGIYVDCKPLGRIDDEK